MRRFELVLLCGLGMLVGGAPADAAPVTLSWTGTLQGVFSDLGGGTYSGTSPGQTFSGTFTYDPANVIHVYTQSGDSIIDSTDRWAEYALVGSGSITDGSTQVSGNDPTVSITNDYACDTDGPGECADASVIYGTPISTGTLFDVWGVDIDTGTLEFSVQFGSLDTTMYGPGDLALSGKSTPPWSLPPGQGQAAFFRIDEASFSGWGSLTFVPEPGVGLLLGLGLTGLAARSRRAARQPMAADTDGSRGPGTT